MHMVFRTLLAFFKKKFLVKSQLTDTTTITMRVLPTDLDLMWHVNNGVYFSLMDFGRWDMVFRNGMYDLCNQKGWYAVVAGETIKFKRSLKLWDKFQLETQIVGHDDKYFFIKQKFTLKGELMATGLVKVRFLKKKGGAVDTQEIMSLSKGHKLEDNSGSLSNDWYSLEKLYLT